VGQTWSMDGRDKKCIWNLVGEPFIKCPLGIMRINFKMNLQEIIHTVIFRVMTPHNNEVEYHYPTTSLHMVTTQKTMTQVFITVKTSDLASRDNIVRMGRGWYLLRIIFTGRLWY